LAKVLVDDAMGKKNARLPGQIENKNGDKVTNLSSGALQSNLEGKKPKKSVKLQDVDNGEGESSSHDDFDHGRKPRELARMKKSHSEHGLTSAYTAKNARFINFYSYAKSKHLLETGGLPPPKKTNDDPLNALTDEPKNDVQPTQQSNTCALPNPWLRKPMPKKIDKRSNFQDIIGNLDKKLKKSQLSYINNRHFSLPQLKKVDNSRSTNSSAKKDIGYNPTMAGSGGMGLRNNPGFDKIFKKDWDGAKSGDGDGGKEMNLKNSYRSNQDSLRTLKQVHNQIG
jgi:hypothetical protein